MAKRSANIKNTGNIGFEEQLWKAAEILWGSMSPSNYQNIVLGLIFLKYISDKFDARYKALVDEGAGFEEDPDAYMEDGVFYVPEKSRWTYIQGFAGKEEIGQVIDNAMVEIEDMYPKLKGVLPKDYSKPDWDKQKLGEVILQFSNIMMNADENDRDVLGRTYEYFLTRFSKTASIGGEFFTPPCIVKILVEVIKPYKGKRIYDPCCGSGGMFVQSKRFIEAHSGRIDEVTIYGQDSNPETWRLCKMNLAIRGIDADLGDSASDTFLNDKHPTLKADFILANPPFNLKSWGGDKLQDDPRWSYGRPPVGNANFAWIEHMISHLSTEGRIGLVLANGALSSNTGNEGEIRKNLIIEGNGNRQGDLVEGIVSLPAQLFYTVQIPVSLWFFSRRKEQKGKTLFIDARNLGHMVSRTQKEIRDEEIEKIANTFERFRKGEDVDELGFAKVATTEEIAAQDYILTPGRYVGIPEEEDDGIPFEEKMKVLTTELSDLFKKSHELEEEIRKQLKGIGYEL